MIKVLVVATSRKTRGGITSVVKAYENSKLWEKYNCHWIQTHNDKSILHKIIYFITGLINYIIRLPFYNIIHIHTADYNTEKRKRIFVKLAILFKKKIIIHLHSSNPEVSIRGKYKNLYKYSFTHANKLILLSNSWKDEATKAFSCCKNKMEVLYNPCPKVKASEISEREDYILFAGTLSQRKGYSDLIKAFAIISKKFPTWRLKLAGNGEIEKGLQLAQELNISDKVDFLGWINGSSKDYIFRHSSIYCLPSYSEGFPMGVLDAWAYNLPVITTPVGGLSEIVIDEENCIIFEPGDINTLSQKLSKLISNKALYNKMTEASKWFAEEKFNISNITTQLEYIYDSLYTK